MNPFRFEMRRLPRFDFDVSSGVAAAGDGGSGGVGGGAWGVGVVVV